MQRRFTVTGMTCSACSAHVEKSVLKVQGVESVAVNLLQKQMTVVFDAQATDEAAIIKAVEHGGYGARVMGEQAAAPSPSALGEEEAKGLLTRLWTSLCFLLPLFYLSMGSMLGAPLPSFFVGMSQSMVFALAQLILTLPILIINQRYFVNGFRALFHGAPNMDTLIAIGAAASVGYSLTMLLLMGQAMGAGNLHAAHEYAMDLYFESAATILTLITLGKYLEARSKGKTSQAIEKLLSLAPKTATVLRDGEEVELPLDQVVVGDVVVVKSGQGIPVDGVVLDGHGVVDESALTGESVPVDKMVGDKVIGSTLNKTGYFTFQAQKVGSDTTFAKIIELVEAAGASKAPIAKLADKVSGVFVPMVMGIALLATVVWLIFGASIGFALSIGIAVLVISCPCALGLATPTAIMVGTGKGAQLGILFKSAQSLERAHQVDTVVLDKTGTITTGKPQLTDVVPAPGIKADELLAMTASAERLSEHPLGVAVVQGAQDKGLALLTASDLVSTPGGGISCTLEGKRVTVGNAALMRTLGIGGVDEARAQALAEQGKTVLYVAQAQEYLGLVAVMDVCKPTSAQAVAAMKGMGLEVIMLTGDNAVTAQAVAMEAGIGHVIAQVLPEEKEAQVRRLQQSGKRVAMVGDGVNDAPALVRAEIGIAIGAGTDVAIESADIVLIKNDLMDAVKAMQLSRATIRNIKQNLFWAFFYNVIGIPLAAGVLFPFFGLKLNPMFGAAAMSLSSVFVVTNALRLRTFRPRVEVNSVTNNQPPLVELAQREGETVELEVANMTCEHCKRRVEQALLGVTGVLSAVVDLERGTATVKVLPTVMPHQLSDAVTAIEYEVKRLTKMP